MNEDRSGFELLLLVMQGNPDDLYGYGKKENTLYAFPEQQKFVELGHFSQN